MSDADRDRVLHLSTKLDVGGLTMAEQFELAHLIRQFMEERDENMVELRRLLNMTKPHGWGYPHC